MQPRDSGDLGEAAVSQFHRFARSNPPPLLFVEPIQNDIELSMNFNFRALNPIPARLTPTFVT
jgi:hypothetical protein